MIYHFKGLLQEEGWLEDVYVTVDEAGIITDISHNKHDRASYINGYAIPGFQNAHSHAFQYAMAGLAEQHEGVNHPDDFWSWREAMYRTALSIDPDQMEAIAAMLYTEMLRHGYTNVAEFHYVHHDKDGRPYSNVAELGSRLIAAAQSVGIGITLIPIYYKKGGFGQPATPGQRRFISQSADDYFHLLDQSEVAIKKYQHANLGIGIHSLRALEPSELAAIAQTERQELPFHMHISEQLKEIEDAQAYLNQRPVEWLLDNVPLRERYHLVHATHMTHEETKKLAQSNAHVVLCPSTEGNLGDGLFPLKSYQQHGGSWSIGTDSQIGINPFEELRMLDYRQRITHHKRNTFFTPEENDSGSYSLKMSLLSGRKAMNNYNEDFFRVGAPLNACIIKANAPLIATSSLKNLTSTIIYTCDSSMIYGTIAYGRLVIKEGRHQDEEAVFHRFANAMRTLGSR